MQHLSFTCTTLLCGSLYYNFYFLKYDLLALNCIAVIWAAVKYLPERNYSVSIFTISEKAIKSLKLGHSVCRWFGR